MPQLTAKRFEGDRRDAALDAILDFSISTLLPFLKNDNSLELAEVATEHFRAHLATALAIELDETMSRIAARSEGPAGRMR